MKDLLKQYNRLDAVVKDRAELCDSHGTGVASELQTCEDRIIDAESLLADFTTDYHQVFSVSRETSSFDGEEFVDDNLDGICSDLPYIDHDELDNADSRLADIESELDSALQAVRDARADLANLQDNGRDLIEEVGARTELFRKFPEPIQLKLINQEAESGQSIMECLVLIMFFVVGFIAISRLLMFANG